MMICQTSKKKKTKKQSGQEVCALHASLCYRVLGVHRPHRPVPTFPRPGLFTPGGSQQGSSDGPASRLAIEAGRGSFQFLWNKRGRRTSLFTGGWACVSSGDTSCVRFLSWWTAQRSHQRDAAPVGRRLWSPVLVGECSRPGGQTTQPLAWPCSSSAGSQITHGLSAGPPSAPSLLRPWHVLSLALFLEKCTVHPPADKTHPQNDQFRWWF